MKKIIIGFILFTLIMANLLAMAAEVEEIAHLAEMDATTTEQEVRNQISTSLNEILHSNIHLTDQNEEGAYRGTDNGIPVTAYFHDNLWSIDYPTGRVIILYDIQTGQRFIYRLQPLHESRQTERRRASSQRRS